MIYQDIGYNTLLPRRPTSNADAHHLSAETVGFGSDSMSAAHQLCNGKGDGEKYKEEALWTFKFTYILYTSSGLKNIDKHTYIQSYTHKENGETDKHICR